MSTDASADLPEEPAPTPPGVPADGRTALRSTLASATATATAPLRVARAWLGATAESTWLVLLAAAVRVLVALGNPAILPDSVDLLGAAGQFRDSGSSAALAVRHHPLVPWATAELSHWLDLETAAITLGIVGGALAVYPLHALARRCGGRHAAIATCILYAVLPKFVEVSAVPLAEGLFLPFFLGALVLAIGSGTPGSTIRRAGRAGGAGILCGVAYLCRPEALVGVAGASLAAWAFARPRRGLLAAALVLVGFGAVAGPYVGALTRDRGHLTLSPKKDVSKFAGVTEVERAPAEDGEETSSLKRGLLGMMSALESSLHVPGLLLLAFGAFPRRRWKRWRSRAPRLVLLLTALALLGLVVRLNMGWGYGGGRHALAASALLLPFVGEGVLNLGRFLSRVTSRRRFGVFVTSLIAIPFAARTLLRPPGEGGIEARALGDLLAERGGAGARIVVGTYGEPLVAYYAAKSLRPQGDAQDVRLVGRHGALLGRMRDVEHRRLALAQTLRDADAGWLVVDLFDTERERGRIVRPQHALASLLQTDGVIGRAGVAAGTRLVAFPVLPAE